MSLINDMLKNLEKRTPTMGTSEGITIGLQTAVSPLFKRKQLLSGIYAGSLICALSLLSAHAWHKHKHKLHVAQQQIKIHATQASSPAPNEAATQTLTTTQSLLTGVALQVDADLSSLRLLLNQDTLYNLDYDINQNTLTIIMDHTSLLAALPKMNYTNSGIENIQAFSDSQGNLKLVLKLANNAEIKHLDWADKTKSPELLIELAYKPEVTNTLPVTINNPIVENTTEQQYQQALKLSASGEENEAINLLANLLEGYPNYHQGREFLVRLLIRQGNRIEAMRYIDEGLRIQASSSVFAELKAHLLVDQGKTNLALSLLEKNAPDLARNPDYHAFIAALYQRLGRSALAANMYKQLLAYEPNNAKWWLALGVSLDAMGDSGQAAEAYRNADTVGELSPELKAYVETQLHKA